MYVDQPMRRDIIKYRNFLSIGSVAASLFLMISVLSVKAQSSIVNAILFYSPTCPACHKVIQEDLPLILDKYGSRLNIIGIDVTIEAGRELYLSAVDRYQIPEEKLGVPCLIIGDTVLVGAYEIPEKLPGIIDAGLASGGITMPDFPGLQEALTAIDQANQTGGEAEGKELVAAQPTIIERFKSDLAGNLISVIVLIGMVSSVIAVGVALTNSGISLGSWPDWITPVLALIGLGVAGYLTFVEITHGEAICGPVGNCNAVQQSPFAMLLGVLPIGVLGAVGYIVILLVWVVKKFGKTNWSNASSLALWVLAIIGVLFSIYLTFLEPFVIGATCAWCITSAVIMTLIFWATSQSMSSTWRVISR